MRFCIGVVRPQACGADAATGTSSTTQTFNESSDQWAASANGAVWGDWTSIPDYFEVLKICPALNPHGARGGEPSPPATSLASSTATASETTAVTSGTATNGGGAASTSSTFSSTTTFNDSASLNGQSPTGFTGAQPNTAGSLETGLAQLKETDQASGTNTYGVTDANYNNVASETASYSYFTTTDTTPGPTDTFYQEMKSTSTTSTTTETGSYTTSAPGGPFIVPGPDNPGGYAKFSETRNDSVSVTNSATISWFASSSGSGTSENAGVTYNGGAGSSVTSDKTTTFDAANQIDKQSGNYTIEGGKDEVSIIGRNGSAGGPGYGVAWKYAEKWTNSRSLLDTGSYPAGGTSTEVVSTARVGSETDTWGGTSPAPAGAWAYTGTSTWSNSSGPTLTTAPDGIAQAAAAADSPQPAPDAASGSKAWWERDPTGILPGLVGGYQFLTKDHAAEYNKYSAIRKANALGLSMTGDVAAFRAAEGQAIGQQLNNVLEDIGKWANGYTTGLQLLAGAPGAMKAAKGFVEGEFLNCTLLQKACFAAGTPLNTPERSRLVETLTRNVGLLSRPEDDPTAPVGVSTVDGVFVLTAQIWELHIGRRVIETTAEHPFYLVGRTPDAPSGWTPLNWLKHGDLLLGRDAITTPVERVVRTDRTATVYNVRVEPDHTFFVGGDDWGFSLWAHNACSVHLNNNAAKSTFGVYKINVNGVLQKIGKADMNRITQLSGLPTRLHQQLRILEQTYGKKAVTYSLTSLGRTTTQKAKLAEFAQLKAYFIQTLGRVPEGNAKSFFPDLNWLSQ